MAKRAVPSSPVLSQRALNRALLARQALLERVERSALEVIELLCGMQAQAPYAPYVGLWTRQRSSHPSELAQLLTERRAVRMALMRSTVHLVSADDALWLRPLLQPMIEGGLRSTYSKRLVGVNLDELTTFSRALLEEQPMTFADLGARLVERWPEHEPMALAHAARALLALAQLPPRGVWGQGGLAIHTTLESWLGRELEADPPLERLVLRYLAAFGPASVRDIQTWSGMTRLREVVERLRPQLVSFRDEDGVELFDLPDAPRPDAETPAPPRFLPEFDNLLLSHADRRRVIPPQHRSWLTSSPNGMLPGSVLIDGFFAGQWSLRRQRDVATLRIALFDALPSAEQQALEEEGMRLVAFLTDGRGQHSLEYGALSG
jgi:hypothetical protein